MSNPTVSVLGAGEAATDVLESQEQFADVKPGSILWKLREQAKHSQETHEVDLPVGGEFGDWLMIRYKTVDPDRMDVFLTGRINDDSPKALQINMDLMAQACIGIVGHNPETGEKELLKGPDGKPLVFEQALIDLLEMPIAPGPELTARDVISLLFSRNGVAIGNHGNILVKWMQDPKRKLDLGEASTLS